MLVTFPDLPWIDPVSVLAFIFVIIAMHIFRRIRKKHAILRKERARIEFVASKKQARDDLHEEILDFDIWLLFESGFYNVYVVDEVNPATNFEEFRIIVDVEGQDSDELIGHIVQILVSTDEEKIESIVLTMCNKDTTARIEYEDNFPNRLDLLRVAEGHLAQFAASHDRNYAHG